MTIFDSFHGTAAEAYAKATRRKSDPSAKDIVIRVEPSRYGGFRVRAFPADLYIDQITDGPMLVDPGVLRHLVGA